MNTGRIMVANVNNVPILKFVGDVRVLMSSALDNYCSSLYGRAILDRMIIDMTETQGIDSTALGLLAKMAIQLRNRFNVRPTIVSTNPDISRILKSMSMDMICEIVEDIENKIRCLEITKGFSIRQVLIHDNGICDTVYEKDFFANFIDFGSLLSDTTT